MNGLENHPEKLGTYKDDDVLFLLKDLLMLWINKIVLAKRKIPVNSFLSTSFNRAKEKKVKATK